jgi:hypothetical protein
LARFIPFSDLYFFEKLNENRFTNIMRLILFKHRLNQKTETQSLAIGNLNQVRINQGSPEDDLQPL